MPNPLDYENPRTRRATTPIVPLEARPAGPASIVAVPAAFDHRLIESDDHGGIGAIASALRARKIDCFRSDVGDAPARRPIALWVRAADAAAADVVAATILARRRRFRSHAHTPPAPGDDLP